VKALTLYQPWASLVALGVKTIETRSWSTDFRGPLAIHAGKKRPQHCLTVGQWQVLDQADGVVRLAGPPLYDLGTMPPLPLGAVVATCVLADVVPIVAHVGQAPRGRYVQPLDTGGRSTARVSELWLCNQSTTGPERITERNITDQRPYGDFTPGRYALLLEGIQAVDPPIPWRGRQGLWNLPPEVEHGLQARGAKL
jgi:hypothetical protein